MKLLVFSVQLGLRLQSAFPLSPTTEQCLIDFFLHSSRIRSCYEVKFCAYFSSDGMVSFPPTCVALKEPISES